MSIALQKRKELAAQASLLRLEVESKIAALENDIKDAQARVEVLQVKLEAVRAEERLKSKNEKKVKSKAAELAGEAKQRIESLRQALIDAQRQRDESRAQAAEAELILSNLKQEYNPNFNDEGVKRAVRSYEDYAAKYTTETTMDFDRENEISEIAKADDAEHGIDFEKWENEEEATPRTGLGKEFYRPRT